MLSLVKILAITALVAVVVNADDKANEKWLAACKTKNPCKDGQVCQISSDNKQVCACPVGYTGAKCAERDCQIKEYKGKAIVGKVFIDQKGLAHMEKLDELAQKCNVQISVTRSFTRSTNPEDNNLEADLSLFVGQGIDFEINDASGKLMCNKACLAKAPAFKADSNSKAPLLNDPVSCFLKAVKDKHSTAGRLEKPQPKQDSAEYQALLKSVQVGCELEQKFPQSPKSNLIGKWKLVGSKNWDEFLEANNIGWWTRMALKTIKPDVEISNTGRKWVIATTSTFKNLKFEFTEGVAFKSKSPIAGDNTDHIIVTEGKDKMIENQTIHASPKRQVNIVREFKNGKFVQTMTVGKVVCERIYDRI